MMNQTFNYGLGQVCHVKLKTILREKNKIRICILMAIFSQIMQIAFAQSFQVTGVVKDINGEPLTGVSVKLKNSAAGGATDENGRFRINVPDGNGTLVFNFISYTTQEVAINNKNVINVILQSESTELNEVVVVGYGTMDKKEVTSAISHVSGKDLAVVGSNDPLMKLQGKVSGLTIQNTSAADPNSNASIQLRGVSTRSGATSPLVVIDGVPGGNITSVNENDIESIDILKDGAASAIYGTRASNGVILITTKRGAEGPGRLTYNGFTSFDVPTMALKPLSAEEWRERNRGTDFGASTNWIDEISNPFAFTQKHSVSFAGGGSKTTYRATADYQNSDGLDLRSGRRQYGARVNISHTGGNGLYDIIMNIAPRFAKSTSADNDVFTQALNLNPTMPVMNPDEPSMYYMPGGFDQYNPVELLKLQEKGNEFRFLDWNAVFKLNVLPTLSTQIQVAQISRDNFSFDFRPSNMTTQIRDGNKGTASREYEKNDQYSFEWLINYSLNVKKHSLKLLGVYSYQYFVNSGLNADNRDFPSNALTYNDLGSGTYNQLAGRNGMETSKADNKLISFRGRVNYAYDDKYLFSASLTRDGSSRFGANNKWAYFPGISIGWRLTRESFLKNLPWVSDLKVRADYGETGNQDAISNYQSLARYAAQTQQYMYNGNYVQVWGPDNNVNPDLRWEKLKNYNIGLDFSLFDNKLGGTINYYSRKAVDLLGAYNAPQPPNIAATTTANVGTMESKGIEIELYADVISKKNFQYSISLNGATQNAKFVSFSNDLYKGQSFLDQLNMPAPGSPGNIQRLQEGKRLGMFYAWRYAGVDENGQVLVFNREGTAVPVSASTQDDKAFIGNGQPKFTGGMTHSFKYKKLDASASFRGNFGYDIFNVHDFYYGQQSAAATYNVLPSAYGRNAAIKGISPLTDYFLESGNFLKLDVVTVGYTFSPKWKYFESVRIYGSTRNLVTFTSFTGVDPDLYPVNGQNPGILLNSDGTGGSKSYYPSTTQYLVGLQLNF